MKISESVHIVLTPTILAVMREVPADQIDNALRKSFPNIFSITKSNSSVQDSNINLLDEIRALAITSEPVDTVKLTREVRKQYS